MNSIRKERLVLAITSLACISCILQNIFGKWEFWVPFIAVPGLFGLWVIHFMQKMDSHSRTIVYFIYAAFLVFYHGVHDTSLYEVSVATMLFMTTFTILDNINMINMILLEFVVVMGIQFRFLYINNTIQELDAFNIMRIVFHTGIVFVLYVFSRITINGRLSEQERIDEWHRTVGNNERDTEDFLSNISHELRTPVNVINGMTALVQKAAPRDELDTVMRAGVRLSHQIEDIQDYTEIKRGELVLEEENYTCVSLINDVVALFRSLHISKDIDLIVDLDPKTPTMLKGDIRKLHKLFRHLLDNAVKFTERGGVYIRIFPVEREYGINLMIEVTDTGIGMTRSDMSGVSKGLYQANKKRNRSTGGIGIGLPIVYGFVHKMGGFVKIESKVGNGTTVRLSVPQKIVDINPCLSLAEGKTDSLVLYTKPEKYRVPQLREFYKSMAVNLARGLNLKLYTTGEKDELLRLLEEITVSHIFTDAEEYSQEKDMFDGLAEDGYKVIVSLDDPSSCDIGRNVMVNPRPLYGFPVVRILNDEHEVSGYEEDGNERIRCDGVRALIVDDEPMNLVVASGLFRDYGMTSDTAESGKEAIQKYEDTDYDVIFMDHMMPEMDGVEAMKRLRQIADTKFRHPVIIALTANALSGAREMFLREGFDGFIAKPIDIGEFERVMKNTLPEELIGYERRAEL